ncbi:hypothetical protein Cni_G20320 [Canna indica]|uniref:Uncharacterized protein n=1 Tax=Canna indica TaxID=4628 RepID=A0AAQ3QG32_9LILI|nr:hypothetical protein Cni_G20320 [Canna indica]
MVSIGIGIVLDVKLSSKAMSNVIIGNSDAGIQHNALILKEVLHYFGITSPIIRCFTAFWSVVLKHPQLRLECIMSIGQLADLAHADFELCNRFLLRGQYRFHLI